jgi:hypothetical protein
MNRLIIGIWLAVFVGAAMLAVNTTVQIEQIGLTGPRPPLSAFDTALRIVFVFGAIVLLYFRRHPLERLTLIIGAAAAGSSALYGFGVRSDSLSAFRLLSHLAAYTLGVTAALRSIVGSLRPRDVPPGAALDRTPR